MPSFSSPNSRSLRRLMTHRRDDESGLTTLEWLLIVAAVAGLAALAIVLVTQVVEDTSEQISGNNARITSLSLAADDMNREILRVARAENSRITNDASITDKTTAVTTRLNQLNAEYRTKCENLGIIYSDVESATVSWRNGDTRALNFFTDMRSTNSPLRFPECMVSS